MSSNTALQFTASLLQDPFRQVSHGFFVGDVLRYSGSGFVLAQADTAAHAQVCGMVSALDGPDMFWITQIGDVGGISTADVPYTPGTLYYLSETTAGLLVSTPPNNTGEVVLPCFIALTVDSGFFFTSVGQVNQPEGLKPEIITSDTNMEVNTIYYANNIVDISMMLPVTASPGDIIKIIGVSTNEILITQSAGQSIIYLDNSTSIGTGGGLQMLATGTTVAGSVEIHCYQADTHWTIFTGSGNWDFI